VVANRDDVRNDQAFPSLQTPINKEGIHRYRTVRLRQSCLAGVVTYAHNSAVRIVFPDLCR